jgi:hypothetical protein
MMEGHPWGYADTEARQDYLRSAIGFQKAAGFKDSSGSSAMRLDGDARLRTIAI